jgi:chemotaxis response regulator CheB
VPGGSGLALVVILHLPAARRSVLAEILGRWTTMRVVEADDGAAIEADHV